MQLHATYVVQAPAEKEAKGQAGTLTCLGGAGVWVDAARSS